MQIAIASGKGGTGKTSVATSLALCADGAVQFLDCDVEEPNGHIFLKPEFSTSRIHTTVIPHINDDHCSLCGKCRNICRFNAITMFGETIMVFSELCHSCNGCFLVCEDNAIARDTREIGVIESGYAGSIDFVHGRVRIGEAMGVSLIKEVKKMAGESLVIIDAPPGTSCPFVETVRGVDYVILVTEPTPFGLYDLKLTVQVLRDLNIPHGVVINRSDYGDHRVEEWCTHGHIPVLMKIPFQRSLAEGYARGETLVESLPELLQPMQDLLQEVM
ncbi:MAG: ATP-binding protein [Desulfobulbaceae bacterium]|jgi:MinD superfamily P-loop ATPase|nr:ATP-binding protein [Desulfobulbaceae bacterium]